MVKPANAQSIPTPSAPDFSVTYVSSTYFLNSTDPYTGANKIDTYLNNSIVVTIQNQPSVYENLSFYYNVQEKGHFGDQWNSFPTHLETGYPASSSEFTVVEIGFESDNGSYSPDKIQDNIPSGGQVDFQVEALLGYYNTVPNYPPGSNIQFGTTQVFEGESSGWSNTETITIANGSTSTSISLSTTPNPMPTLTSTTNSTSPTPISTPISATITSTSSPAVPELSWWVIVPLLLSLLSVVVILSYRKTTKLKQ